MPKIWTVGHSTRTIEELISLLKGYEVERLADIRTVPRSRTNPQFNKDELERTLPEVGIDYIHMKNLGGLRKPRKDSPNAGWHNESFRGFADYMQTPEFVQALLELMRLAQDRPTAIMCAETLPWRCHRSLIADALTIRGFEVIEIFNEHESRPHKLTQFAVVDGDNITYPPEDGGQQG
jgi:uncharacterized protein (DUF488 family)